MNKHDRKIVDMADVFGADDVTQDLILLIERLDKQQEKILALLERVVKASNDFDVTGWPVLIKDIKTLLKEAKEVKG